MRHCGVRMSGITDHGGIQSETRNEVIGLLANAATSSQLRFLTYTPPGLWGEQKTSIVHCRVICASHRHRSPMCLAALPTPFRILHPADPRAEITPRNAW